MYRYNLILINALKSIKTINVLVNVYHYSFTNMTQHSKNVFLNPLIRYILSLSHISHFKYAVVKSYHFKNNE